MKWTITYKHKSADSLIFCISPPIYPIPLIKNPHFYAYFLKISIILRFYFDLRFYLKGFNAVGKAENWNPLESQIHSAIFINFIVSIAPDCIAISTATSITQWTANIAHFHASACNFCIR